jgi:hypothetical protein
MAAERLGCHWQTVIYREKKGDLTGLKIGGRKYYALEEVEKLIRSNPVVSKPHWTRLKKTACLPESNLTQAQMNRIALARPTLWQRIKSLFV